MKNPTIKIYRGGVVRINWHDRFRGSEFKPTSIEVLIHASGEALEIASTGPFKLLPIGSSYRAVVTELAKYPHLIGAEFELRPTHRSTMVTANGQHFPGSDFRELLPVSRGRKSGSSKDNRIKTLTARVATLEAELAKERRSPCRTK